MLLKRKRMKRKSKHYLKFSPEANGAQKAPPLGTAPPQPFPGCEVSSLWWAEPGPCQMWIYLPIPRGTAWPWRWDSVLPSSTCTPSIFRTTLFFLGRDKHLLVTLGSLLENKRCFLYYDFGIFTQVGSVLSRSKAVCDSFLYVNWSGRILILVKKKKKSVRLFWMPRITDGNEASVNERRFTYKEKGINANHSLITEV